MLNAAAYGGYKVQGIFGSVMAPSRLVLAPFFVIAMVVRRYYDHLLVKSILCGLRRVIIDLVVSALISIATEAYRGLNHW
ncbi:MAG: chromate transporter [Atribacterota bacterium]